MKFSVPAPVRIALLVIGTTAIYTYIGQLVPQKEIHPPEPTLITDDMTTDDLVVIGLDIMSGKGLCFTCHTIGKTGSLRFPDLGGIASRADSRIDGLTGLEYLADSIYDPDGFIVDGFSP